MLYELKTFLGYSCNCLFLSNDANAGTVTGVLAGVGICHFSCLPRARECTWSLNPERPMDECLADLSALGFSLTCSWVKRGTYWVSVRRHQSEEKPSETEFLHLPLGANKARDELIADSVKALVVEIASHTFIRVTQKAGIPICFLYFCLSRFPSVSLSWHLPLKGRLHKLCSLPTFPEAIVTVLLS